MEKACVEADMEKCQDLKKLSGGSSDFLCLSVRLGISSAISWPRVFLLLELLRTACTRPIIWRLWTVLVGFMSQARVWVRGCFLRPRCSS